MYSWELEKYLKERSFVLTRDEYYEITPQTCPQIIRVLFNSENNHFYIYTNDDYVFEFEVINN